MKSSLMCAFLALLVGAVVGCGNSTRASKSTFARAIGRQLEAEPEYLVYKVPFDPMAWSRKDGGASPVLGELARLGLVEDSPGAFQRYTLRNSAGGLLSADSFTGAVQLHLGVCDGEVEVERFTPPQALMGQTISEVEYSVGWKPTALLTDSKYAGVREALGKQIDTIQQDLKQRTHKQITLLQYSDGWHVAD